MTWQLTMLEQDIAECMVKAMALKEERDRAAEEGNSDMEMQCNIRLSAVNNQVGNAIARRDHFIMHHSHETG